MGLGDTWLFHSSSDARLNFYSLHKKSDLVGSILGLAFESG